MNISAGLSEISFLAGSRASQNSRKVYLWPVYNAGAITRVQSIVRENESGAGYIKPYSTGLNEKPSDIRHEEYSSNGKIQARQSSYYPGYYFNALA